MRLILEILRYLKFHLNLPGTNELIAFHAHKLHCDTLLIVFPQNVCLRVKDNAYWIRVAITDSKNRVSIPYAVYYPGSPYLFLTNMRVSIAEYLLQVSG